MNLNVHATVESESARTVAAIFERRGWSLRNAGFAEFEVETPDAELIVEAAQPVLVHGPATRRGYEETIGVLREAGVVYLVELYNGHTLIASEKSSQGTSVNSSL